MDSENSNNIPLCVDLDGTLVATDTLFESILILIRNKPIFLFVLPFWLLKGKPAFKQKISDNVNFDPTILPYRKEVVDYVTNESGNGREIVLATASMKSSADAVANNLGIFTKVIATVDSINVKGKNKRDILVEKFGQNGFDYIGDSKADIPVFEAANKSLLVTSSKKLIDKVNSVSNLDKTFYLDKNSFVLFIKEIRLYQWAKNVLLFIPLLMAHLIFEDDLVVKALYGFFAFGFAASSVYIFNDLLDLESDRIHPRKRKRPIASGELSILSGLILAPLLLIISLLLSVLLLNTFFTLTLLVYLFITTAYTLILKRFYIVDIIILASLYTIRLIAGAIAVDIEITPWLLEFSMFIFLSLALVKRFTELKDLKRQNREKSVRRGYHVKDMNLLRNLGPVSGYMAVLVFGLYIHSGINTSLYKTPEMLWAIVPFLLYWITRIWFKAHRGEMHDDPIVFTVKDPVSYVIGIIVTLLVIGAAV